MECPSNMQTDSHEQGEMSASPMVVNRKPKKKALKWRPPHMAGSIDYFARFCAK